MSVNEPLMPINAACFRTLWEWSLMLRAFTRCGNDCLFFDACYYDYKCLMYETE